MACNSKSQLWFTDFVIASFIFSFILVTYYAYTTNIQDMDVAVFNSLLSDAESISSSLLLAGYPENWDNNTVQIAGITNGDQRIDGQKLLKLHSLPYNRTKKLLGTTYDYLIFFTENNGTAISTEGICGIGAPEVNITYQIRSAYYYDSSTDSFLKNFMSSTLNADIYSAEPGYEDFDEMAENIGKYGFVAIEHPALSASIFNNNKAKIESFAANKSLLMLSGEITTSQGRKMAGAEFYKKSGVSISDRNSTVMQEDEFLSFETGENIIFRQAYYVRNTTDAMNTQEIAKFNADNEIAVARWNYGNGSVFYFSDFDTDYFSGNFIDKVTQAIRKWGKFSCYINISGAGYKNFVKVERSLIYDSKPIKMVVYLWD